MPPVPQASSILASLGQAAFLWDLTADTIAWSDNAGAVFTDIPVEALASGKPVVALGRGGALETVPGFGGVLYDEPAGFADAIERLRTLEPEIRPAELQAWARQFSEEEFLRKMGAVLEVESGAKTPNTQSRVVL